MKNGYVLFLLILLMGCGKKVAVADLPKLNGYWEINSVVFANGDTKDYSINTVVDYIELADHKGFRKKMVPQFNGSYSTSDDAEPFSIINNQDSFIMQYGQGTNQWEETILYINEDNFAVRTAEKHTYHYKRYTPINITP